MKSPHRERNHSEETAATNPKELDIYLWVSTAFVCLRGGGIQCLMKLCTTASSRRLQDGVQAVLNVEWFTNV